MEGEKKNHFTVKGVEGWCGKRARQTAEFRLIGFPDSFSFAYQQTINTAAGKCVVDGKK